ncbi:membrane fusion protein, multidrug efflux system [Rhizobiales bacterium GAS113]|nr:membrane fusion protein, multidrug efflux system [Rhizobiales bacterium GAS113]
MLKADIEDRGAQVLHEGSHSVPAFFGRPSGKQDDGEPASEKLAAWARQKEETPSAGQPQSPPEAEATEEGHPRVMKEPRKGFSRRRPVISAIGAMLLAATVGCGYVYLDYAQHFESTDDAFIASRQVGIAPKVSGYVTGVLVTDNQHVEGGDVIARIDDRDFRVALEQADAQVAAAEASIRTIDAQIVVQQAQIQAAEAQVEQARAALVFAQQQAARYDDLARKGAGSVQNSELYGSQLLQQQAALKSAQATLAVAQRQIDALKAQLASAQANLAQANAQRDQAKLNLSYTTVTAAQAGRIVNLSAAAGEFAQAGTSLTMFVPDEIWVTANFKETQLDAMRPGQKATLEIDAYPEREILGRVESVQPGSGTAFSLLPAQNATGNYVKVVQRVPVKIVIENPPADVALGPGMSVVPSVRTDPTPSLYERQVAVFDRLRRHS